MGLFAASFAMAAPATTSLTVLFDLPKTLVQEVDSSGVEKFDKKAVLNVNGKYYLIADQAISVLAHLSFDSQFKIAVTSKLLSSVEMSRILAVIPHPTESGKTMADLVQVIPGDRVSTLDARTTFLLTGKDSRWAEIGLPQANILPEYFAFASQEAAQQSLNHLQQTNLEYAQKNSQYFPVDEYSFRLYKQKMAGAFSFVNKVAEDFANTSSLSKTIEGLSSYAFLILARNGSERLSQNIGWVVERGMVMGCEMQFPDHKATKKVSLDLCRFSLETKLDWKATKEGGQSCFRFTARGDILKEEDLEACAPNMKFVYLWLNYKTKECGVFTSELAYLKSAPAEKCVYNIEYNLRKREMQQFLVDADGRIKLEPLDKIENYKFYHSGARASLMRKASYATLLLKDPVAFGLLDARMPRGCADELKKLYASGATLFSETLRKAARAPLEINYSMGQQNTIFYHWTSSGAMQTFAKLFHREISDREQAHQQSVQEGAYEEIFRYLRANPHRTQGSRTPKEPSLWASVLYLAKDRTTSSGYGQSLLEFHMLEDAKILLDTSPAWGEAIAEIGKKYPTVAETCGLKRAPTNTESYGCGVARAPIYFVMAEDSNIDMISYEGCGSSYKYQFFQMLSPAKIKQIVFR